MHDSFRALLGRYKSYQSVAPCTRCSSGTLVVKFQRIYRCSIRFIPQVLKIYQFDRSSSTLWISNTPVIPLSIPPPPFPSTISSLYFDPKSLTEWCGTCSPALGRGSSPWAGAIVFPHLKFLILFCYDAFQIGWPCYDSDSYLREDFLFYKWWWFFSIDFFASLSSSFLMNAYTAKINGPRYMFIVVFMCHVSSIWEVMDVR